MKIYFHILITVTLLSCNNNNALEIYTEDYVTRPTTDSISKIENKIKIFSIYDTTKRIVAKSHFINTSVSEYLPVFDEKNEIIYFTAMDRKGYFDFKLDHIKSSNSGGEDIFYSVIKNGVFSDARPLTSLNTNRHEAVSYVCDNGNLIITGNYDQNIGPDYTQHGVTTTDIFMAKKETDTYRLIHFDEPINSIYTEADAIYEENEFIMFVSDRPNGVGEYKKKGWLFNGSTWGNTDVYISFKNGDYWSEPLNLGEPVNSPGSERTPWLSEDKKRLFVSSNGYTDSNDLDIFYFERKDINNWSDWRGPFKLVHLCTDQDDWGYKIFKSRSFLSKARLLPFKTSQPAREGDGGIRETNFRSNYEVYGLQIASLKKTQQSDIYEVKDTLEPDFTFNDVLFKKEEFKINNDYKSQLDYLVDLIKVNSETEIKVVGHTDSDGDEIYNLNLSKNRATSVKEYLKSQGVKNKITVNGVGEKYPLVKNNSNLNKRKNRRVEIFINSN